MNEGLAIITGGAGTLGRAIGDALAAQGHAVILADLATVEDPGPGQTSVACDITDPAERAALAGGMRARSRRS
jgi:NAD(P)-dependent dehydrogenase (short-subunit alcohol dehydrogenase family)